MGYSVQRGGGGAKMATNAYKLANTKGYKSQPELSAVLVLFSPYLARHHSVNICTV